MHQLRLNFHHALLENKVIPNLRPALRRMAKRGVRRHRRKALLRKAEMKAEYHRTWFRGEQPREGTRDMELLFLAEEVEEARRMYGGHLSAQRVERSESAQIWRAADGHIGGCEGWYDLQVIRVEDIARYERYRVCLRCRSEKFMAKVREFYKCA